MLELVVCLHFVTVLLWIMVMFVEIKFTLFLRKHVLSCLLKIIFQAADARM